jgi:DNA polymerase
MIPAGKRPVFYTGGLDARIFFIGDAPGEEEESSGEPFAGASGQLLSKMIGAMKLTPDQVCIGTILPWRPALRSPGSEPVDRPVSADELAYGMSFIRAAISIVRPEVLVVLGQDAAQGLLGTKFKSLAEVRGQWREFEGLPAMVTCKPSNLLRRNNNKTKREAWEELLKVMERCGLPVSEKQRGYFLH